MNPDQNQNPQFTPGQPGQEPTPTPQPAPQPMAQPTPTVQPAPAPTQPVMPTQPQPAVPQMDQTVQPTQSTGVVTGMPDQTQQPAIDPVTGLPMQQQPTAAFSSQPMQSASSGGFGAKASKKNLLLAVVAIVVVAVLGLGAYFLTNMLSNSNNKNKTNQAASESTSKTSATPLGSLKGVSFMAPDNLSGYTKNPASTDKVSIYTKGDCSLQFGTTDATTLPGTDLADIVSRQIKTLKDNGVTIDGPTAGTALVLKDSSDAKKQYSMPTLVFKANKAKDYAMSYYSAVVFANGTRAFVTRACASSTGPVQTSAVDAVNADAVKVTVMPQM